MTNNHEKKILNTLLDKYEKSKSFTGDNKVNQRFIVKVASLFPQYTDHANYELFRAVNDAVDVLARKNMVSVKRNKGKVCSEVALNVEEIDQVYGYIGRVAKKDIVHSVGRLLEQYRGRHAVLDRFCHAQAERMERNKPVQLFNGDLAEFENILLAVDRLFKVEEETFARDFSVRVFRDSKVFDRISTKVVSLLYEYGDFPEESQVLASLNIVKNPTYVNFKGAGAVVLSGQRIDLNALKSDIAISSAMLEDVDRIEITGKSVMTIENLTSFHMANKKETFLIYLGGFHNRIRRAFIEKIHRQNPDVEFYHFGDLDAGGFYILEHLRRSTGIDFKPYKMDVETLKGYEGYTRRLTANDRLRLGRLKGSGFDEVIDYMLEHDCKLEQEAIRL